MQRGEIYSMPFPFTNLKDAKIRPVLVLQDLPGDDCIVCMITTQLVSSQYALPIAPSDTERKSVKPGCIRPDRLVTCEKKCLLAKIDKLKHEKLNAALQATKNIFD